MLGTHKKNLVDFLPACGGEFTKTFWRNYWQFGDSIARSSGSVPTEEWKLPENAARTEDSRSVQVHREHSANKESWARRLRGKLQSQQWLQRDECFIANKVVTWHVSETWTMENFKAALDNNRWEIFGFVTIVRHRNFPFSRVMLTILIEWIILMISIRLDYVCTTCLNNGGHSFTVLCCFKRLLGSVRRWSEHAETQRIFRECPVSHQNVEIFVELRVTGLSHVKSMNKSHWTSHNLWTFFVHFTTLQAITFESYATRW